MDFSAYSIDQIGAVNLSEELNAWVGAGTTWRRFWLYHRICREAYQRREGGPPAGSPAGRELVEKGVLPFERVVPLEDCAMFSQAFSNMLEGKYGSLGDIDKTVFTLAWNQLRAGSLRRLLPQIFSSERKAVIEQYFGSYFQILGVSLNRYFPSPERDVSFLWHRDYEPPQQLHFMVYLTGASDAGGRTEVLDLESTRRAAESGYSYPALENRTSDLEDIFGNAERIDVVRPELEPGGGMLFAAPRNLHRGVLPVEGWRDTLLFLLMPSPIPWDERAASNFPTILRGGAHINCSLVNPFGRFSPAAGASHENVPDWARLSQMEPAEGLPD